MGSFSQGMAEEEGTGVAQAAVCLCVLCGLPASGKSTLSRTVLGNAAQLGWRATVVPYDDLIPQHAFRITAIQNSGAELTEQTEWKLHRRAVLQCIELFLRTPEVTAEPPSSFQINPAAWERCVRGLLRPETLDHSQTDRTPLLFILDDNFYYPSMRYEVYQLARKYSLGFCQVYLHCDLESCISRNHSRPEPVPTEVILDMVKRLESPNPEKNTWEELSILLNTTDKLSTCDIQRVMALISSSLKNPLSPMEDSTDQKEADRQKCATNVVHQADQACRRLISEAMKTAKENHVSAEYMRCWATRLNEAKATLLCSLREKVLQETSLAREEDIDVERVVKRAVDVFDRDRKEILMRIISEASHTAL